MTTGFGFCGKCGKPRSADVQKFCSGCGSAFSSAAPLAPVAPLAPLATLGEPAPIAPPPAPVAPPPMALPPAPVAPPPVAPPPLSAMPPAPPYAAAYPGGPMTGYAGPPAYAAPGTRSGTGSGVKILRRLLVAVGILVVAALVTVSWLGVAQVPGLSSAFGMDHPRDLHMTKDTAALDGFCQKWGIERPSPAQNYTLSSKHHYSGSVQVDDTISETALAALPEYSAPDAHVSQMQFRVHEGSMELSAFVNVPGYPATGPVYAQFSIAATSSHSVAVDFSHLDFGRIGVPSDVVDTVKTTLNDYLNQKIVDLGITIDTLQLHEGGIRFKGTWPKTITADPPTDAGVH